jgi:hypothetical protein
MKRKQERERHEHNEAPRPSTGPARNMHDDIDETCDDICSCEPEPRWQRVAEENERGER